MIFSVRIWQDGRGNPLRLPMQRPAYPYGLRSNVVHAVADGGWGGGLALAQQGATTSGPMSCIPSRIWQDGRSTSHDELGSYRLPCHDAVVLEG